MPRRSFPTRHTTAAAARITSWYSVMENGPTSGTLTRSFRPRIETRSTLTDDYPNRWHIEECFNFDQSLGWRRAGTMNINIRYGQMTMALLAQTVIHQFRNRLGNPLATWDANHLATAIFRGLDGDIRVVDDTIVVTYYNAPNQELLRTQYEDLPAKLAAEGVDPRIPWLYGFQLDFRFR